MGNGEDKLKKNVLNLGYWSGILTSIFTVMFLVLLVLTFNFDEWNGIQQYASNFKFSYIFATIPSIFLASTFLIFVVSIHYYATQEKKMFSHLAIVFGVMYATLSTANYLIQLISIGPSLLNNELNSISIYVTGHPHSIFYALMASYLFMCLAVYFISFVFADIKIIKNIFLGVALSAIISLASVISNAAFILPISGLVWGVCLIFGPILVAFHFKKIIKRDYTL